MASDVGIVNSALLKIGEKTITTFLEDNPTAAAANEQFDKLRDDLLRLHTWNFAIKRQKLAQSVVIPVSEFDFQYPIPADFLRIVEVHDNNSGFGRLRYQLEHEDTDGTVIVSSATEVWLKYVSKVTDPNLMSPDFREALAFMLARDFALTIAQSNRLHELMDRQFTRTLRRARSADGIEDYPPQFPSGSWADIRN